MKQIIFFLSLLLYSLQGYSQSCIGSSTVGTHNVCTINNSKLATMNVVNIDSLVSCKYYGSTIGIQYGGTGATSANGALNNLLPNQSGNSGTVFSTDGSSSSWQDVNTLIDSNIFTTRYYSGITFYPFSNPAGYISSYTETDPLFDSKFSAKSTSNLSEGSNLYYTEARFTTSLSTKSTSDLTEGSNWYYTSSRFNTSFAAKTTSDLAEGTRMYYTTERFNNSFSTRSTSDLGEGDQLYFTIERARLALSAGTGISYNNSTGEITNSSPDQTVSLTGSNGITATGTYPNFTIAKTKRQETYSGTTNGSGVYTVTFGTSYSVAPNIQANIVGGNSNQVITMTVTNTGFTCTVVERGFVNLLGIDVLLSATTNVNGASVDVLITEK